MLSVKTKKKKKKKKKKNSRIVYNSSLLDRVARAAPARLISLARLRRLVRHHPSPFIIKERVHLHCTKRTEQCSKETNNSALKKGKVSFRFPSFIKLFDSSNVFMC